MMKARLWCWMLLKKSSEVDDLECKQIEVFSITFFVLCHEDSMYGRISEGGFDVGAN